MLLNIQLKSELATGSVPAVLDDNRVVTMYIPPSLERRAVELTPYNVEQGRCFSKEKVVTDAQGLFAATSGCILAFLTTHFAEELGKQIDSIILKRYYRGRYIEQHYAYSFSGFEYINATTGALEYDHYRPILNPKYDANTRRVETEVTATLISVNNDVHVQKFPNDLLAYQHALDVQQRRRSLHIVRSNPDKGSAEIK